MEEETAPHPATPAHLRSRDTAERFVLLALEQLAAGGRGALVLPDGFLFGGGSKARLKKKLLEECDLHTVVRLPKGVFHPYTAIKTNLLFFTKGAPTRDVWFYEHAPATRPGGTRLLADPSADRPPSWRRSPPGGTRGCRPSTPGR